MSKFAFAELHEKATRRVAADFLWHLAAAMPSRIHTVLTDYGTHFTDPISDGRRLGTSRECAQKKLPFLYHPFELACAHLNIEHRLPKPRHTWTSGQVDRMNRTLKDATVKRYHYETHEQLRQHLTNLAAYNLARRLQTMREPTPYEAVYKAWTNDQGRLSQTRTINRRHQYLDI